MFQKILVPLDGSELAESALETAGGLARAFAAQLHLVRCLPERPSADFAASAGEFHEAYLHDEQEAQGYLETIRARLSGQGLSIEQQVLLPGQAAYQIARVAEQQQVDLIVLTSHGRSGFSRLMLGSVAETLARTAPCPVMILRQPS